jgi:hypothetical protein
MIINSTNIGVRKTCPKLKTKLRGLSPRMNYTDSGRRRSAKLVPTFADRRVSRGQRNGSPRPLISAF